MKKYLIIILLLSISISATAQEKEKIRGNKEVIVMQTPLEDFSILQIGENFNVTLVKGKEAMVEIETDENLHEVFLKETLNDTFALKTTKDIRRSKKMRIRITFTDNLETIIVKDKAVIEGLTSFSIDDLTIEAYNDAKVFASITADFFKLKNNDEAEVELNLKANDAEFQLNQFSKIKALVNAENFKADTYESATARIEGDVTNFTLRADNSAKFTGENLTAESATVISEGRSVNSVHVTKNLEISAGGTSKTSVFGNPAIDLKEFTGEAALFKKELMLKK